MKSYPKIITQVCTKYLLNTSTISIANKIYCSKTVPKKDTFWYFFTFC